VLTSPTLYDPATTIGRSASFLSGAPQGIEGALAGQGAVRTFITDSQLTLRPSWSENTPGVREIHAFIKSFHLIDSFTTHAGFSVKAGILAPTRPVSAGEIEGGSPSTSAAAGFRR
jgi:hypothetical protein